MITTVHELEFCATGKKYHTQEDVIKPNCVIEYNRNMGDSINLQASRTDGQKIHEEVQKVIFRLDGFILYWCICYVQNEK